MGSVLGGMASELVYLLVDTGGLALGQRNTLAHDTPLKSQ